MNILNLYLTKSIIIIYNIKLITETKKLVYRKIASLFLDFIFIILQI